MGEPVKVCFEKLAVDARAAFNPEQRKVIGHSGAEAFAARATGRGVGVIDLEPSILQRVLVVELGARDIEGAFGIDHHANTGALHEDVASRRLILQVHFVLEPGASPSHHRDSQHTCRPTLLRKKGRDFVRGGRGHPDQSFIPHAKARNHCLFLDGAWYHGFCVRDRSCRVRINVGAPIPHVNAVECLPQSAQLTAGNERIDGGKQKVSPTLFEPVEESARLSPGRWVHFFGL